MPHMPDTSPRIIGRLTPLAVLIGTLLSSGVQAASFDIGNGTTVTTQQTLNNSETGVIQAGGALNVAGAYAVYAPGSNVSISNKGSITTTGDHADGIRSTGTNASISHSGSTTTTGANAFGIRSTGTNASISHSGSLSTTGYAANGIGSYGTNASITHGGSITTTGNYAYGIVSSGTNASITNSGSIATTGDVAHGILSEGTNASITHSGSITTMGDNARGIWSAGTNTNITHSGSISTTGNYAYGINSSGTNANITHSGSISVTGASAIGIRSTGTNGVINVSGRISATGAATQAILGANNQTLNLQPGAQIIGTINLGSGTNAVNVIMAGAGPSSTLSITNAGTISHSGSGLSVVNGNTVAMVDATGLTADQASLGFASASLFQALNQRLNQRGPAPQPIKLATTELIPGMLYQEPGPSAWGHAFGGNTRREASDAALGFRDTGYGLIGGYEQTLASHRLGFFGGVSHSDLKTDRASIKTDSESFFFGMYGQYARGDWRVNGALATGYVRYDSKRSVLDNLSGDETAESDYHSVYLSPSLAIIRIFDMGAGVSVRPSAELNYTYGWLSRYDEKGTTRSNLSVGRRNASVLNSRLQVALRQELANHQGEFEVRLGASQSNYGDDKVKVSLQGGAATNYGITGTNSVSGGYVGLGGRIQLKKQFSMVGDVEYTQGSGDNQATLAYLGMEYRF